MQQQKAISKTCFHVPSFSQEENKPSKAMVGITSKLRKAANKVMISCSSFSPKQSVVDPAVVNAVIWDHATSKCGNISRTSPKEQESSRAIANKNNLCAICLDVLEYRRGRNNRGQAIFTAQCCHSFHLVCIASNVRHGSMNCPICRAQWTQLPHSQNRSSHKSLAPNANSSDPVLRIIDDSIATLRSHRRSLRDACYDNDESLDPDHSLALLDAPTGRLHFSLVFPALESPPRLSYVPPRHLNSFSHMLVPSLEEQHLRPTSTSKGSVYLSATVAPEQQPTDLVLVASPTVPHLRLLKQSMALVVLSLRPIDRLAIVTYSSATARVFPLRRMTSCGKRSAIQVIDRLFYTGIADDPTEGLRKGLKILEDRARKNPQSCVLHLLDCPLASYSAHIDLSCPIPIHRFHVGFGFGASSEPVLESFQEFLMALLKGTIKEAEMQIGEEAKIIQLGELRSDEEKRIPLELDDCINSSYHEGANGESRRRGKAILRTTEG